MTDEEKLRSIVAKIVDRHKESDDDISPAWVATEVMIEIEFDPGLHPLGYAGCHLEVRQIAREQLRRFDPERRIAASVEGQDDLFPETLQDRYPRAGRPGEEPV